MELREERWTEVISTEMNNGILYEGARRYETGIWQGRLPT